MNRQSRRGRSPRPFRIRARTERRDPIDYAALAQAALEQAAMDQRRDEDAPTAPAQAWRGRAAVAPKALPDADDAADDSAEGDPS